MLALRARCSGHQQVADETFDRWPPLFGCAGRRHPHGADAGRWENHMYSFWISVALVFVAEIGDPAKQEALQNAFSQTNKYIGKAAAAKGVALNKG